MLIEFSIDTEIEDVLYHTGETMKLNSEVCRQLIESGNAVEVVEGFKVKKTK